MGDVWTSDDGMGIPDGSLGRLLHEVTTGTQTRIRSKDARDDRHRLKEIEQQFQFEISGNATSVLSFEETQVNFDYGFYWAPADRESNLEFPHFTYGSHTSPPVGVVATVSRWLHDNPTGAITGAMVAVGVIGGNEFTGWVHLTFQGFGSLLEEPFTPGAK